MGMLEGESEKIPVKCVEQFLVYSRCSIPVSHEDGGEVTRQCVETPVCTHKGGSLCRLLGGLVVT